MQKKEKMAIPRRYSLKANPKNLKGNEKTLYKRLA